MASPASDSDFKIDRLKQEALRRIAANKAELDTLLTRTARLKSSDIERIEKLKGNRRRDRQVFMDLDYEGPKRS